MTTSWTDELGLDGPWADLSVTAGPDRRVWLGVAAAALGTDLAVRSGVSGLAGALLVAVVAGGLVASGRLVTLQSRAVALAAVPFGLSLAVRMSDWLLPLDVLAAAGLLVLACSLARSGDVLDLTVPRLMAQGSHALAHGVAAPAFLASGLRRTGGSGRLAPVVRGVVLATPVVVVLGLLLGSADAVFASFFRLPVDPGDWFAHLALLGVGAWGMAGLVRLASAPPAPAVPEVGWRLGRVEATTVLGSLVLLYAGFAVSQVVAVAGGAERVMSTTGLTYAEYARSGFFQLLAVAALTLALLLVLRAAVGGVDGRLLVLSEVAVALTLVIVAVALRRLGLYEDAFGLTMLRLYSVVFAIWTGAVFVLLGLSLAGLGRPRAWLVPAAVGMGLAMLLGLNLANPEAAVVRRNLAHAESGSRFDPGYLAQLSDDAVPALVEGLDRLSPTDRARVVALTCADGTRSGGSSGGWWAYNGARDGAVEARNGLCRE